MGQSIEGFWAVAARHLGLNQPTPAHFAFGDTPSMATQLVELVLAGKKTATAGLVADFENDADPYPIPGEFYIVLDGANIPRAVIKTLETRVGPLNSCDAQFAFDEGEGDCTLTWWMNAHRDFFTRRCAELKIPMHDEIDVVFERFSCVYPVPGV